MTSAGSSHGAAVGNDRVALGRPEEYEHLKSILAPLPQRIVVVPGNHDERGAMRNAFAQGGYLPDGEFLNLAIDDEYPLRLIGLDTVIPGKGGDELCARRLDWLDREIARMPEKSTLIMIHHPPFRTGIGHMDVLGLFGKQRGTFDRGLPARSVAPGRPDEDDLRRHVAQQVGVAWLCFVCSPRRPFAGPGGDNAAGCSA